VVAIREHRAGAVEAVSPGEDAVEPPRERDLERLHPPRERGVVRRLDDQVEVPILQRKLADAERLLPPCDDGDRPPHRLPRVPVPQEPQPLHGPQRHVDRLARYPRDERPPRLSAEGHGSAAGR
jgi:hypothetical protein